MSDLIQDRGRGPEIAGTRVTVYNLLQPLLDSRVTEAEICRIYDLTAEQVAAVRAYILNHADTVLAQFLDIEKRMAAGNPPEVREQAQRTMSTLKSFKQWLAEQELANHEDERAQGGSSRLPTFREWLAERERK